ncbi:RAI1 like PD-XK nuclease-domain-containing protein, partial [Phakopsora pachyrhizi]
MPVNLSHLLNSNPVSPPRSLENRIRSDQQSQGPSPRKLSDLLLSPEVSRIQVSLDQSDSLAGWGSSHRDDGWNNQQLAGLSSSSSSSSKIDQRALLLEEELMKIEVQPNVYELKLSKPAFNNSFERPITEPIYQRPIPITSFSYNSEREMLLGSRKFDSLRPFQLDKSRANPTNPHLGCDLNLGFKEAVYREESVDEGIDGLLNCLGSFVESCSDEERPSLIRRMEETSFITWRGMMTKICSSVYETSLNSGWEMNLMMFNGTIYIEEQHPINIPEQDNQLQCYHGYSYENLVSCLPSERIENVNTNIQWCSVVKTNLNRIKMIIGGEVDCIDMERYKRLRRNEELRSGLERQDNEEEREAEEIDPRDFVEIKTSMAISNEKQKRTFYRFKLLKFYLQSFLLGTPIVHVGFRDHSGVLQKSENFKTESIPQLVKSSNFKNSNSNNSYNSHFSSIKWSASLCLENGTRILKFI